MVSKETHVEVKPLEIQPIMSDADQMNDDQSDDALEHMTGTY